MYISVPEAARRYNVSATSIRRYIAQGRITGHRIGPKLIRIDVDQLEKEILGKSASIA